MRPARLQVVLSSSVYRLEDKKEREKKKKKKANLQTNHCSALEEKWLFVYFVGWLRFEA